MQLSRGDLNFVAPRFVWLSRSRHFAARVFCAALLFAPFALTCYAQEESLGDAARRERERKRAQLEAEKDKDGYIWVKSGDRADLEEGSLTSTTHAPGQTRLDSSPEECRARCMSAAACHAYKYSTEVDSSGRLVESCSVKVEASATQEKLAPEAEEALGAFFTAMILSQAFDKGTLPLPPALARFSNTERRALSNVLMIHFAEQQCRKLTGSMLTLKQLEAGACKGKTPDAGGITMDQGEMEKDADYSYGLTLGKGTFTFAARPKSPGLSGFLFDGTTVRAQAGGAATASSPSLGTPDEILKSIVEAQPKTPGRL